MSIDTLTIVGVGLIGGSIGLAARKRGLTRIVRGVGRDVERLKRARALGAIDEIAVDPAAAAASSDLIVVCTPVDHVVSEIVSLANHAPSTAVLTDVGSTKAVIVDGVAAGLHKLKKPPQFVGSHPLAGSEKQGVEHARDDLFQDRWTIVTPTSKTPAEALLRVGEFWRNLGAKVRKMEPAEHDQALAMTSHLPHLLAAALAGVLPPKWHDLTASGFRDTTRIAASDPELWAGIFTHNRASVLDALAALESRLSELGNALKADDRTALVRLLREAQQVRESL